MLEILNVLYRMETFMRPETPNGNKEQCENLKELYDQLCQSYRAIDDFRTKLLGFLPLATAAGAVTLLVKDLGVGIPWDRPTTIDSKTSLFAPLGIFGLLVTFGLYAFELYGMKKCHALIQTGMHLEERMGDVGQFRTRPKPVARLLYEPFAGAMIYPAVISAWTLIAMVFEYGLRRAEFFSIAMFVAFCSSSILYGKILNRKRERGWLTTYQAPRLRQAAPAIDNRLK